MQKQIYGLTLLLMVAVSSMDFTFGYPANSINNIRSKRSALDSENPDDIVRVLMKLAQDVILESDSGMHSEKRGIDLGLSRGFSGSQAAKHLMGLAAANFANGPGRRRRDLESQ